MQKGLAIQHSIYDTRSRASTSATNCTPIATTVRLLEAHSEQFDMVTLARL